MKINPSVFKSFPWSSRAGKMETEIVARNIMVIRKRLGNKWELSWTEYKREREKDGKAGCTDGEQSHFEDLIKQIPDAIGAIAFSPSWAEDARKSAKKLAKAKKRKSK